MIVEWQWYRSSISLKKMLLCSGFKVKYPNSSIKSTSRRARRFRSCRVERSASDAYISSNKSFRSEDVALLRFQGQISKFVNQKYVQAGETFQELPRGTVGQRRIHLIEQVLRADELATVAVLQRFQQQATR